MSKEHAQHILVIPQQHFDVVEPFYTGFWPDVQITPCDDGFYMKNNSMRRLYIGWYDRVSHECPELMIVPKVTGWKYRLLRMLKIV